MTEIERSVANRRAIEAEIDAGVVEVKTVPNDIQFSTEHRCNLRCVMCYSTVVRNQGGVPLMDERLPDNVLGRFEKLQPSIPYFRSLALSGSGEPLLSPAMPAILDIVADHRWLPTTFTTHLQVLNRAKAEKIVKSGVHAITVSVDGACKETYERIRVHSQWEKLLRAIDLLNAVKREFAIDKPAICFAANCMRQNIEELPDLIEFAHAHGGVKVLATNTIIYDVAMEDQALVHYPELTRKMVVEAIRRARRLGIEFDNRVLEPPGGVSELDAEVDALDAADTPPVTRVIKGALQIASKVVAAIRPAPATIVDDNRAPPSPRPRSAILQACQMPWNGLMVESNGLAKVCCYTSPYIGNLNEQTLDEIWNGEPAKVLRRSFLEGRPPEGCRNCFIFTKTQPREDVFVQLIRPAPMYGLDCPQDGGVLSGQAEIVGWATAQAGIATVEIVLDDNVIGAATTGLPRNGIVSDHPNAATSGFSFQLDTQRLVSGFHMFALRLTDRSGNVTDVAHRLVRVHASPDDGPRPAGGDMLDPDVSAYNQL